MKNLRLLLILLALTVACRSSAPVVNVVETETQIDVGIPKGKVSQGTGNPNGQTEPETQEPLAVVKKGSINVVETEKESDVGIPLGKVSQGDGVPIGQTEPEAQEPVVVEKEPVKKVPVTKEPVKEEPGKHKMAESKPKKAPPPAVLSKLIEIIKSQKTEEKRIASAEEELIQGINGLIIEQTMTKIGYDFYEYFFLLWELPGTAAIRDYNIYINEKASPTWGSWVQVDVNQTAVWSRVLKPRSVEIEEAAKEAVEATKQYLANYDQYQFKTKDMAGTGI